MVLHDNVRLWERKQLVLKKPKIVRKIGTFSKLGYHAFKKNSYIFLKFLIILVSIGKNW